jgi:sRNA-binding carbon storage regulator CsrA
MLHLNRQKNQVIHLTHNESGDTVDVVVLEVRGKTVKLGFENDTKSHTILRKEVKQAQQNHADPNPFYRDKKPTPYEGRPLGRVSTIPMVDMQEAVDGLEQLVDQLIPTTEDKSATVTL